MKIYAFGDSFTDGYNDDVANWVIEYVKWKGYKPKSYIDHVSDYYGCEVLNFAKQGNDNYSILESFMLQYPNIEEDDIIIINWSDVVRFRIVNDKDVWRSIIPNYENLMDNLSVSENTLNEMLVNRMSQKFIDELNTWINFIYYVSKSNKVIQWTVPSHKKYFASRFLQFETIEMETKGEIQNRHYSEKGNLDLSKKIIEQLENNSNKNYIIKHRTVI